MMITADGYFEGPNHDISWHNVDSEFAKFAVRQLDEADTLIFGRRTYELMAGYWPTYEGTKDNNETARQMNSYRKVVFSKTLKHVDWENTELHADDVSGVMNKLRNEQGKDIAVLGSSNLCLTLIQNDLLDEIRLMVNPVILGSGTSLFAGLDNRHKLSFMKLTEFKSGNVLLTYGKTD